MKNRILAILLILCLALSLAACSSGGGNDQSLQSQEASQSSESSLVEESSEPTEDQDESSEDNAETPEINESGLRPAKGAEDPIFDKDTQELLSYMAKSISEDYLVPNGISSEDFVWPTDQAAWDYYNSLLNQIYTEIAIGGNPEPISEDLIPASPDKEIMDAASQGVANWLHEFESVESGYLDHLYVLLKDPQYIQDFFTFE